MEQTISPDFHVALVFIAMVFFESTKIHFDNDLAYIRN